jgi:hypothetical protein
MKFLILVLLMLPFAAYGENRFILEPAVEVKEVHDDNLNYSADEPLRDHITRVTPTLGVRFDSARWSWRMTYGLDSERFATHSVLDSNRARERAGGGIQYQVGPRLMLSVDSTYLYTNTLADLNVDTGLAASRIRGRQVSMGPAARFRISPRLTAIASVSLMNTDVQDGVGMRSQTQMLTVERRLTPRSRFTLDYQHSRILFDGQAAQLIDTHTILAGWSRDVGARSHWMLRVGPRLNNRSPTADLTASLTHNWRFSSVGISLLRTQTTAVGFAGAVETRSAQAKFAYAPGRRLTAFAAPAVIRNTREQLEGTVYRLALGGRYAITPMLAFDVAYNLDRQDGAIDPLLADAEFSHATLSVGLTTRWVRER